MDRNRKESRLPRVASQLADRRYIGDDLGIRVERKVLRDLPDKDLSVLRSRGDDAVVERVPRR